MSRTDLAPSQAGWEARLALTYSAAGFGTRISRREHCGPLRVQKSFHPEGPEVCHSLILHPPGGVVGGDRLDIKIDAQANAHALVTTPGAAKWYRSVDLQSEQKVHLSVAAEASLEWLPQENIVFSGANTRWLHRVDLASQASYVGWDITCLGRPVSRETFALGTLRSRTEIFQDGKPLWSDQARIDGGSPLLESPAGWAGFPVFGTLIFAGAQPPTNLLEACRTVCGEADSRTGVTVLPQLLVARYLGRSTEKARAYFLALWHLIRPAMLDRAVCAPRIWHT